MNQQAIHMGVALVALLVATLSVMTAAGIRQRHDVIISSVRALAQLLLVALVIAWIFLHPQWALGYVALMIIAATITATIRIGCGFRHSGGIMLAILAGAAATIIIIVLTGALARDAPTLLPFTAQMIGGAMTASLLAGSRLRHGALERWGEVEGYLALGTRPRQAVMALSRHSIEESMAPILDQTKSAGLVLLPGSFVGLLLGGATPLFAAQVQLLVLFGLILTQVITAILTTWFLAKAVGSLKPSEWAARK